MKANFTIAVTALLFIAPFLDAASSSSASYNVLADTTDAGGKRVTSASYTNDGSAGAVAVVSTVASPAETLKSGFIAQLADVTALQLAASPLTINENGTRQLSASQLLDDATTNNLLASAVSWSVLSGPITSISTSGLATAGVVAQDTSATVQGGFGGLTGSLNLTVLDTIKDNFGSYAGDGIGDDWQVQYFGTNNPNAGPNAITDGSGLTNLFKYTAGLVPNDATSKFSYRIEDVPGFPLQKRVIFSPRLASRNYSILTSTTLTSGGWSILTGGVTSDNGDERTVTDPNAGGEVKFYQVQIVKP